VKDLDSDQAGNGSAIRLETSGAHLTTIDLRCRIEPTMKLSRQTRNRTQVNTSHLSDKPKAGMFRKLPLNQSGKSQDS
jgi:hypothetical protein